MPSRSLPSLVRSALSKPAEVVAYRVRQEAQLQVMRRTGRWPALERRAEQWWTPDRVTSFLAAPPPTMARDGLEAVTAGLAAGMVDEPSLREGSRRAINRRFAVFGVPVPPDGPLPWHEDWRFGHRWPPGPHGSYDFSHPRERSEPYDVKFPWELSRLHFLLPALHADVVDRGTAGQEFVAQTVSDWLRENPLANSVNWQPMEASVRGINLVGVVGVWSALHGTQTDHAATADLLTLLAVHGEFIWRTREFTDVRGNHYAANVTALALLGVALEEHYPPATAWADFAAEALVDEVHLQLLADGIDFEKSLAYHRLVTMFFLLAAHSLRGRNPTVTEAVSARLRQACQYSADCTTPSGKHPGIGDSDDATVLGWDGRLSTDPAPLHAFAAAWYGDGTLRTGSDLPVEALWLQGSQGLEAWRRMGSGTALDSSVRSFYPAGGAVVVREAGTYLWVDVGEVGLSGRGGHGHNDVTSFELWMQDTPLVVDPGSYMYTGDMQARDLFRSTRYHNVVEVDETEMAPLVSLWRIGPEATPTDVEVELAGAEAVIRAGHRGYERLGDPVRYHRTIAFDPLGQRLTLVDSLAGRQTHRVRQLFHLSTGVTARTPGDHEVMLSAGKATWVLRAGPTTAVELVTTWRSHTYGHRESATTVVLTSTVQGSAELHVEIVPADNTGEDTRQAPC